MLEVRSNLSLEELANANYESKKAYKVSSIILIIIGIIGFVLSITMMLYNDSSIWTTLLGISTFFIIFCSLMLLLMRPKSFKKRLIKENPALKDGVEYTFTFNEDSFLVNEKITTAESNNNIKYEMLKKVVISTNFIYLYINRLRAFPIKRTAFNEKDLEEFKKLLGNKII